MSQTLMLDETCCLVDDNAECDCCCTSVVGQRRNAKVLMAARLFHFRSDFKNELLGRGGSSTEAPTPFVPADGYEHCRCTKCSTMHADGSCDANSRCYMWQHRDDLAGGLCLFCRPVSKREMDKMIENLPISYFGQTPTAGDKVSMSPALVVHPKD